MMERGPLEAAGAPRLSKNGVGEGPSLPNSAVHVTLGSGADEAIETGTGAEAGLLMVTPPDTPIVPITGMGCDGVFTTVTSSPSGGPAAQIFAAQIAQIAATENGNANRIPDMIPPR